MQNFCNDFWSKILDVNDQEAVEMLRNCLPEWKKAEIGKSLSKLQPEQSRQMATAIEWITFSSIADYARDQLDQCLEEHGGVSGGSANIDIENWIEKYSRIAEVARLAGINIE